MDTRTEYGIDGWTADREFHIARESRIARIASESLTYITWNDGRRFELAELRDPAISQLVLDEPNLTDLALSSPWTPASYLAAKTERILHSLTTGNLAYAILSNPADRLERIATHPNTSLETVSTILARFPRAPRLRHNIAIRTDREDVMRLLARKGGAWGRRGAGANTLCPEDLRLTLLQSKDDRTRQAAWRTPPACA